MSKKVTVRQDRIGLWVFLAIVACINFAAHLVFYQRLPEIIPIHWNMAGVADGFGPRWVSLILDALPLAMLALMWVIPRIDPKGEAYQKFERYWHATVAVIILFFCVLTWITEAAVFGFMPTGGAFPATVVTLIGVGLIATGNYLPHARQNYTFGVKTPWALADEHCWQRTQRMGGITFIVIGLAMIVVAVLGLVTAWDLVIPFAVVLLGGTVWMYLYSYLVYAGKMR